VHTQGQAVGRTSAALRLLEEHPTKTGYQLKERVFDVAVLVDALRRIDEGETVVDPTIVARLIARRRIDNPLDKLTKRAGGARARR
jgi:DNA-binding NarL/FixJ family response regulator